MVKLGRFFFVEKVLARHDRLLGFIHFRTTRLAMDDSSGILDKCACTGQDARRKEWYKHEEGVAWRLVHVGLEAPA